jgi:hypothetical protein
VIEMGSDHYQVLTEHGIGELLTAIRTHVPMFSAAQL